MDHAVKVQKEITAPKPFRKSRAGAIAISGVCVLLMGFSVYSWVAKPEYIWGVRPAAIPPAVREANLRFGMFLLAQRLESYRDREGAYPAALDDVEEGASGMAYQVISDAVFELRGTLDGKPIVLRSDESVDAFLGNSAAVLQDRAR